MSDNLADLWHKLFAGADDRAQAVHDAYQQLDNAKVLNHLVVHRYLCGKCGVLATVIRVGEHTVARTRDYKFSPGKNEERSAPKARPKNTLDGKRHWPGHTYDVDDLAEWGQSAGFDVVCRHVAATLLAVDVLETVKGVHPGHPGKPTRL